MKIRLTEGELKRYIREVVNEAVDPNRTYSMVISQLRNIPDGQKGPVNFQYKNYDFQFEAVPMDGNAYKIRMVSPAASDVQTVAEGNAFNMMVSMCDSYISRSMRGINESYDEYERDLIIDNDKMFRDMSYDIRENMERSLPSVIGQALHASCLDWKDVFNEDSLGRYIDTVLEDVCYGLGASLAKEVFKQ